MQSQHHENVREWGRCMSELTPLLAQAVRRAGCGRELAHAFSHIAMPCFFDRLATKVILQGQHDSLRQKTRSCALCACRSPHAEECICQGFLDRRQADRRTSNTPAASRWVQWTGTASHDALIAYMQDVWRLMHAGRRHLQMHS